MKSGLEFGNGLLIVDCITKQTRADTECKRVSKHQLQEPQLILFPILETVRIFGFPIEIDPIFNEIPQSKCKNKSDDAKKML